ncbi:MAG: anthranilate phosphoribosyltransferase [Planctomycetota bacterium]|nr:MAG: anthranilate phosphoribosyltransferase [Planctomycetota bacterium]
MHEALAHLLAGGVLTETDAQRVFESVMRGQADPAALGAMLALIQARGAGVDELVGAARVMRRHVTPVPTGDLPSGTRVVDTCGTGGAAKTFNVSTVAAIIAAAAGRERGVVVAKHGNRSRTGRGSAEVLRELGVNIDAPPEVQARCLAEAGVCFSFAVRHHPAMTHAAPVRRALGFPTIFNLLGPLTNPAGATRQVLGVYDEALVEPMARALARLGAERAIVAHGRDGLDELSTCGQTVVAQVRAGAVEMRVFDAASIGLGRASMEDLRARDLDDAARLARAILRNDERADTAPARDLAVLNAAAALVVGEAADDLAAGVALARRALEAGAGARTLDALAAVSNEPA